MADPADRRAVPPTVEGEERRAVVAILRAGLALSMALLALGLALALAEGRLRARPVALGDVVPLIAAGRPSGFMAAGILVLLATPAIRVLALAARFAAEGDRRFAAVAVAVGLVLAFAVGIGRA